MTIYKWLKADNSAPIGKGKWTPGRWRSVKGKLIPCENGLHLCRPQDLIHHISERLWIVEIDASDLVEATDKIVVRRACIVHPVNTINDVTLRLFACDCAERANSNYRTNLETIEVARRYAHGKATDEELSAAASAARRWYSAASGAASAAWSAAWSAATPRAANAAWSAARSAAWSAAESAARSAAESAARSSQNERLLQYVEFGEAAEAMAWPS
jgi:hypothetical protein